MSYLLDTCVISELIKKNPEAAVIQWLESTDESSTYVSVLSVGEIQKGIAKLTPSRRKQALTEWLEKDLKTRFAKRFLDFDILSALKWGEVLGAQEKKGINIPLMDSLIAATSLVHSLTVVTRNGKDMENMGVEIVNPWTE